MDTTASQQERPDYGIDAPGVVRKLFLFGTVGLLVWASAAFGLWSGRLEIQAGGVLVTFPLAGPGLGSGIACLLIGSWMLWDSKAGKILGRERLLGRLSWNGDEQVLDVGCGRGLMLIGAARRLTTGKATGIDAWQKEDLSGNSPESALENARREGVADRVEVKTADMRRLPFADNSFDVVVSRAAIHNLYQPDERAQAIREIARVLKPGGQAVIDDIRHLHEYTAVFSQHGCSEIERIGSPLVSALLMIVTLGSLRPATLLVRKSA